MYAMQGKSILFPVNNRSQGLRRLCGAAGGLEDGEAFALCWSWASQLFPFTFFSKMTYPSGPQVLLPTLCL